VNRKPSARFSKSLTVQAGNIVKPSGTLRECMLLLYDAYVAIR
jgi:hypothetical protein